MFNLVTYQKQRWKRVKGSKAKVEGGRVEGKRDQYG